MAKLLNGSELVGFIKERQAKQVRALRQAHGIFPKLVILMSEHATPESDVYVRMKTRYGEDILVDVAVEKVPENLLAERVQYYNEDEQAHGMIVQLPLRNAELTDGIVNNISPEKDVDGLGEQATFDAATPIAINWLLAGYGIELRGKEIVIVGNGRLVGSPLATMLRRSGLQPTVADEFTKDAPEIIEQADIIISAAGVANLIQSVHIKLGAVVVDAGTSSENGTIVGDVEAAARERDDIKITPVKGGVGPLTVAALFDNVITAASRRIVKKVI